MPNQGSALKETFDSAISDVTSYRRMSPSFIEYSSSLNLSDDERYTIERLIERVRNRSTAEDWQEMSRRSDARRQADYQPSYDVYLVAPAAHELLKLDWLSLQRSVKAE